MTIQATEHAPLHVCIINEFFYPDDAGGTGTVLSEMAEALHHDHPDVKIDVVTSNNLYRDWDRKLSPYQEWNGIRIFRLDGPHAGGLSAIPRLAVNTAFGIKVLAQLRRLPRYDLLLIGTAPPTVAMAAELYKAVKKSPYLYIVYDLEPDRAVRMGVVAGRHPITVMLRRSQRRWLHAAAKVIVLGRCMQEYVSRTYGLQMHQVETIAIGSDGDVIRPLDKKTRFRAAEGLSGFVACYAGNFGRYHNFDTILDSAKDLLRRGAGITFALVGGGAQQAHITRRVADEKITNVRMFPFVAKEDYADLLASADVSLVTLEPGMEGLCVPSKFYSILASGRPTVALVAPEFEVARVIDETGCGVHMGQGDAECLSAALFKLSQDPEAADAMGRRARAVLEDRYSTRQVAAQYYQAIQAACQPSHKPVAVPLADRHYSQGEEPNDASLEIGVV